MDYLVFLTFSPSLPRFFLFSFSGNIALVVFPLVSQRKNGETVRREEEEKFLANKSLETEPLFVFPFMVGSVSILFVFLFIFTYGPSKRSGILNNKSLDGRTLFLPLLFVGAWIHLVTAPTRRKRSGTSVRLGHKSLRTLMKRSSSWYLPGDLSIFLSWV